MGSYSTVGIVGVFGKDIVIPIMTIGLLEESESTMGRGRNSVSSSAHA
jgi:hypothetical protein